MVRGTMTSSGDWIWLDTVINPGKFSRCLQGSGVELGEGKDLQWGLRRAAGHCRRLVGDSNAQSEPDPSSTTRLRSCWDTGVNLWYQVQSSLRFMTGSWVVQAEWKKGTGQRECSQIQIQPGMTAQYFQVVTVAVPLPAN